MHSFGKSLCQLKKPSNLRRTGHRKLGTGIGNHRSQPSAIVLVGNSDGSTVEGSSLYKPDDYPVLSSGRPLRVESSVALPVPTCTETLRSKLHTGKPSSVTGSRDGTPLRQSHIMRQKSRMIAIQRIWSLPAERHASEGLLPQRIIFL